MKTNTKKPAAKTLSANAKLQADLDAAKARKVAKREAKGVKAAAPKPVAKKAKAARLTDQTTVSGVARKLILEGKTNEQVLDSLMSLFPGFDVATKKHYPGWYRAELVRKGVLSRTAAKATAHKATAH